MTKLTSQQIQKIISVKTILQEAEQLTSVPWQAIAAVWFRESFSVASPTTLGGPFQFDPIPAQSIVQALIIEYTSGPMSQLLKDFLNHKQFALVFESAAILAACWLRHQCRFNLAVDHSNEAIMDAFYGYNGRAWGPFPESSPYVYNNFDLQHTNMSIRGSIPDPKNPGRRLRINTIDRRPGAFTVYRQLIDEKV